MVTSVFNNTLTHSAFRVTEKLRPKTTELRLFGFGTKQTCFVSLNEFKFLILKIATTAFPGCNFNFYLKRLVPCFHLLLFY